MNTHLKSLLETATGEAIAGPVPGAGKIRTASGKEYFVKSGPASTTYRCEADGLRALAGTGLFRTPQVVSVGANYLLTGYIPGRTPGNGFFETFGRQLARMHRYRGEYFGFYEDNYIGLTPQPNLPDGNEGSDWTAFYLNRRLRYQFGLAERNGYVRAELRKNFARLESMAGDILSGSEEPPCLLHGDLWAGNFLCDPESRAVLIDPAVYYGHREAELAMTRLFGGFPQAFYDAYRQEYPLRPGWEYRENLYRLYHLLNHLNLFGRSYLPEVESIVDAYVSV